MTAVDHPSDKSEIPVIVSRGRKYDGIGGPRVAIAHDYLTQRGGAERVVLAMSRAFPDAPIYTTLFEPASTFPEFADRDVRVSPISTVSLLRSHHRAALAMLPFAARSVHVDADIVVTSSSGWAHGFRTSGRKLVYCYTPARWLYLRDIYLGQRHCLVKRATLCVLSPYLRRWDRQAAASCDQYLAISTAVQKRISDVYGIDADIVPAPVTMLKNPTHCEPVPEVERWLAESAAGDGAGGEFMVCISRLLAYKNVEQVVRAFAGRRERLVVVGRGPEAEHIRSIKTSNVLMTSDLTDAQMSWLYQRCRAAITASYEDYGLTPIEAGMWGRPSVVLRWGGFLDTVEEGLSGIYFDRPEPDCIAEALDRFERTAFEPEKICRHVEKFGEQRFASTLHAAVDALAQRPASPAPESV